MISKISGVLDEYSVTNGWISISTSSGVSYKVYYIFESSCPELGSSINVFTSMIFREDSQTIWGFDYACERNVFESLINVNGVGGKSAQLLIVKIGVINLVDYISSQSYSDLKLPGIGEKTAKKIVLELHSKVEDLYSLINADFNFVNEKGKKMNSKFGEDQKSIQIKNEIIEALVTLGYSEKKMRDILRNEDFSDKTVEQGLKDVLKKLKNN